MLIYVNIYVPPRQQENWDKLEQTLVNMLHYSSSEDLIILNIGILILEFDPFWKIYLNGKIFSFKMKAIFPVCHTSHGMIQGKHD